MLKKPTCPYCRAIYTYKEIENQKNNQVVTCHYCKKDFVVKKRLGIVLLCLIVFIADILINLFLLSVVGVNSIIPLLIVNMVCIIIALFCKPFFVIYKKKDNNK
jgi:NAD-dependent SIR2 family protein deacetylase